MQVLSRKVGEQFTFVKHWAVDTSIKVGNDSLIPYGAGEGVSWTIEELRNVDDPAF